MFKLVYRCSCPRCNRPTEISVGDVCQNKLNDGRVCGFQLPLAFDEFNSMVRGKIEKHTTTPISGFISFNPDTGFYIDNSQAARTSGNIYLDPANGYFFTYITPSGASAIATLCSGNMENSMAVSGFKLPLNSKLHELHGHYANLKSADLFIATPYDSVIESPCPSHPNEFCIYQSGSLVAAWNTQAQSGFVGRHIVVGNGP